MPAFTEDGVEAPAQTRLGFDVLKQHVDLDIDFASRSLKGSTELTIQPLVKDLKQIRLHSRQCTPTLIQAGGITAKWDYDDPYRRLRMSGKSSVHQHEMLKSRIQSSLGPSPEPELVIALPPKLKIQELQVDPTTALPLYDATPSLQKQEADAMAIAETPIVQNVLQPVVQFAPIKITIDFEVHHFRDGIHWVGSNGRDKRYPYLYTKLEPSPGNSSAIFPCLDTATSRCAWEFSLRCPRTLGDAFRRSEADIQQQGATQPIARDGDVEMVNGIDASLKAKSTASHSSDQFLIDLSAEEAGLELTVLCIGEMSDDVIDSEDETRHTVTFNLNDAVTARHVAFAVGPFEHADLTMFRATAEEEKLGQTAIKVDAYCLPGRLDEVENTCFPICQALDFIGVNYGRFPFTSYQLLFIDDLAHTAIGAAGFSICSTRLLFPQEIIAPLDENTRILVRTVANQWSGVNIIPKDPTDAWVIAGIAGYMTDVFMKKLAGNNEYRWQQKQAAERVYELDVDRPSIYQLGNILHLDHSIEDFLDLKSALVLGILDRRLVKSSGSTGVMRIISKIFLNAKTGSLQNGELSTQDFQRTCEKLGHNKLESFFKQWVMGAGCPIFYVTQRFNKKKLMVELTIVQKQLERVTKPPFEPSNFMREVKEHVLEVWAPEPQNVFTGPMTIRIHEADGTPYEHIVEIKEALTRLEIPYNTKYKRLKRSKRQKERALAESNAAGEGGDDALLYCLGDILDTPEDLRDWNLAEWSKEDEEKMGQESYEWIRMDADFEWIGKIHLVMPLYMYISQLQQDRDIVAQYESMRYLLGSNPHHVSLSILVRTLMDSRYFHGIRVMAADGLAAMAKDRLREIGQHHLERAFSELFCDEGSVMPRPNDFSSRETFIIQCAIPKAMARLRDADAKVPEGVRKFLVDKLRFNDNSDNEYSDVHYVATLMTCLADSLVVSHREVRPAYHFGFEEDEPLEPENPDAEFEAMAINEIERYRRIDEWITTYQNIYSTTAIKCLQKLTKAGIVKDKTRELLLYTQPSTADDVRLQAFRCLNEIGLARKPALLKHLLHSLVQDDSPYFRDRLLRIFGESLGHVALGDTEVETVPLPAAPSDGLVLEQEVSTEARHLEATRKTSPEGALVALKATLEHEEIFKEALWYAATSPELALEEVAAFCDIAALVYEPVTSHVIMIKLPRAYKCQNVGQGKLRFYHHGPYRSQPSIGLKHDDWSVLQRLRLTYSGRLSEQTEKHLKEQQRNDERRKQIEALTLQHAQKKQELETIELKNNLQTDMPPPPAVAPVERTGIKISLGGKRKASVDLSQRESSPKTAKLPKASSPSTVQKKVSTPKQRSSTPTSYASVGKAGPLVAVLRLRPETFQKAQEILSAPPRRPPQLPNGSSSNSQPSRSVTPVVPQQSSAFPQPQSISQASPNSGFLSPPTSLTAGLQPPSLNPGGFRSFAPSADGNANFSFSASPTDTKHESFTFPPPLPSGSSSISPPPLSHPPSLTSMSPPMPGEAVAPPPPPKPKLTLKLSRKPSSVDQASPEEKGGST